MGELHLEVIKNRLKQEYKIEAYMGPLTVVYKEAIVSNVTHRTTVRRVSGKNSNEATLKIELKSDPNSQEFHTFEINPENSEIGDKIDRIFKAEMRHTGNCTRFINRGIKTSLSSGKEIIWGSIYNFCIVPPPITKFPISIFLRIYSLL